MRILKESAFDSWLVAVVSLLAIVANLPDQFAIHYSINKDYFLIALAVVLAFCLLRYVRFGLILVTSILVLGANLPQHMASEWNLAPEFMFFALCIMVGIAAINKFFEILPAGRPESQKYANMQGAKSLFKAVENGKLSTVDRLIHGGVNVNVKTVSGKTPLMLATNLGYTDIAQALISGGADVYARDKEGNSPLNIAQRRGYTRIALLLENEISRTSSPARA